MTLLELTGKESGIIIYEDGNAVAAVNWGNMGEEQFPMLSPMGNAMIGFPEDEGWADNIQMERVDDFRDAIPGKVWFTGETNDDGTKEADTDLDIVYDPHGDFIRAFLDPEYCNGNFSATVYTFPDNRIVIAPDMWE